MADDNKAEIMTVLKASEELHDIVADRIYFHFPPNFNTLPAISYFEVVDVPVVFSDNKDMIDRHVYQIDIWSGESNTTTAVIVEEIMKGLEYEKVFQHDMYEEDTEIHHKAMQFQKDIENSGWV